MCGLLVLHVLARIAVLPAFKLSTCVYIAERSLLQQAFWLCRLSPAELVVMDLFYLAFTRYVFVLVYTCTCVCVCVCVCVCLCVCVVCVCCARICTYVCVCLSQSESVFGANCTNDTDCSYGKVFRNGHGKRRSLNLGQRTQHLLVIVYNCSSACSYGSSLTHSVAGMATGKCNTTTSTCMVYAWCPVEEEDDNITYVRML